MSETIDKFVIYGGDNPHVNRSYESVGEIMLEKMKENSERIAFIDGISDVRITYGLLREKCIQLAKALSSFGLKSGDVIAICSENRMEYPMVIGAALSLGVVVAPINYTYSGREILHAFKLSKPKVVFSSPSVVNKIVNVARATNFVLQIVRFAGGKIMKNRAISYDEFVERFNTTKENQDLKSVPVNVKEHVALIMCSSGTTGLPKGVQITHHNLLFGIEFYVNRFTTYNTVTSVDDVVLLGLIPWFHVYGSMILVSMICSPIKMVILPKFEPKTFLNAIQRYKIKVVGVVPPLMLFLAKHPLVDDYDLSSVTEVTCGAAPVSDTTVEMVRKRLRLKHVRLGYGMSETSFAILLQRGDFIRNGSIGVLSPGAWAKIIDLETGCSLGPNQPGEMCFKGPQIMKGYIGNEEATRETIDKDGWLHTGDVGYYDDDHFFFIIDRIKELIKYKAYQVPPAEIEAILMKNPHILDAAVIGIPDEECGELPMAFVVKKEGADITENDIIQFVSDKVSSAKKLRGGVRFISEIPKNASGKILRRILRGMITKSKL